MEALCFGVLAKILTGFTSLNQQETVALLLASVTEKINVVNKKGDPYDVDGKEASLLVNRKKDLHKNIVAASKNPAVINSLESFVSERVSKEITPHLTEKLIENLKKLVRNDPGIPQNLKNDILNHASEEQFSYFFSKILLYTLHVNNLPSEIPGSLSAVTPEYLNDQYSKRLFEKVSGLLSKKNISLQDLCDVLQQDCNITVDADTIGGFLSGEEMCSFPMLFLRKSCKLLGISMDELFSDVDAPDRSQQVSEQGHTNRLLIETAGSPSLITDPRDESFRGYLGTYYAYFTPTHSNQSDVLKGTLKFEDAETRVRARFEIDTGRRDESQKPYLKVYEGELIRSTTVSNCYCVLSSPQVGEMGFITFRYEPIFFGHRSCCLATAMTSSAGNEDRNPVVHRMFLSREVIKEEHLPGLVPFLSLNNNDILISKQDWDFIADSNSAYSEIMKSMLKNEKYKSDLYYCIRESTINDFFKYAEQDHGIQKASFVSALRAKGVSDRYNKVSKKAENAARNYLKENGYYSNSR